MENSKPNSQTKKVFEETASMTKQEGFKNEENLTDYFARMEKEVREESTAKQ